MTTVALLLACALPAMGGVLVQRAPTVSVTYLGNYTDAYNVNSGRDLGFVGKIGGSVINTFGDTTLAPPGANAFPQYPNSAGLGLSPTSYKDTPNTSTASRFCPKFSDEPASWGLGITNVVPLTATSGVLYTLSNNRTDINNNIILGAGVAVVTIDTNTGVPTCLRTSHYEWSRTEPFYGDHSAFLDASGTYIYAMGGNNRSLTGGNGYLFLARVPVGQVFNTSAYQYWNGFVYGNARIQAAQQYSLIDTTKTSITDGGQGQVKYNKYLGLFVMVYSDANTWAHEVLMRTSPSPEGPWSPKQVIYNTGTACNNLYGTYGIVYDDNWYGNDQTINIRWTCQATYQQVIKVTFTK